MSRRFKTLLLVAVKASAVILDDDDDDDNGDGVFATKKVKAISDILLQTKIDLFFEITIVGAMGKVWCSVVGV